jgi:arsenite-transporting ATPase
VRRLGASPLPVTAAAGRLDAVEIDARAALNRWLRRRRPGLEQIALRGTWLDEEDVSRLLRLSLPGIDEIAALLEIARFARLRRYERIVIDTAPTGHTLRMFGTPAVLRGVAAVFEHMQEKHRVMVAALRGRWTADAADALVAGMDRDGQELAALLRDQSRTRMIWVTLPEPMAVEETADAVGALRDAGIPLHTLILNRLTPVPDRPCRWCAARRAVEQGAVSALIAALTAARATGVRLAALSARREEPRGARALAAIAAELQSAPPPKPGPTRRVARVTGTLERSAARRAATPTVPQTVRLALFGGKGGVGKTTCAAAVALESARARPRDRVLLLSTDPAHSLADVLGAPVSDTPAAVPGAPPNLLARELDSMRAFAAVRASYAAAVDALFDRISRGGGFDAAHDRNVMRELIDLAPPGIDELVAIMDVIDALLGPAGATRFDLAVIDTAPTGHALRLLEMPRLVHDWSRTLMSILLKYQPVVGVGDVGALLLRLSKGLGGLREILADSRRARFIAVTRPAFVPRAETVRLLRRLSRLRIEVPALVVNAVGAGTCGFCAASRRAQRTELCEIAAQVRRRARDATILIAPAEMPPPHGAAALRRWHRTWRAIEASPPL